MENEPIFLLEESKKTPKTRLVFVLGCSVALILCIGILALNGLVLIRSDQRGVVISAFEPKGYRTEPLEPGTHWITPFVERVQLYSIAPQTYIMSKESNDEIQARTKDNQQIFVGVSITYAINPSSVIDLHITWQNRYEENVVRPVTRAAIRNAILHYSTAEINGDKKVVIQQSIADEIKQGLISNYLIFLDFTIQEVRLN